MDVAVDKFVTLTCNTGPEKDVDHTPIIQQHYVFLVDCLDAKYSGLVGELYQAEVLNYEEMESISSEMTSFTQNVKLLSMLSRKTRDQFDKFWTHWTRLDSSMSAITSPADKVCLFCRLDLLSRLVCVCTCTSSSAPGYLHLATSEM